MKCLTLFLLSAATIISSCTSQQFDEPEYSVGVDDAAMAMERVQKTDLSIAAAALDAQKNKEFYKDENGFWHPLDEDAKITAQQMNEKIIGHGWKGDPHSYRHINVDGTTEVVWQLLNGVTGYYDNEFKISFHPGYVRYYGKRYWGYDFYYHDDSRLDTDAPVIGYTSTDDRDWIIPVKLIDDNTLAVVRTFYEYKGNGVYALTGDGFYYELKRVSDEELAAWEEKHSVGYWGE